MNIGHLNKSIISYRNIVDDGLILVRQNNMTAGKRKARR